MPGPVWESIDSISIRGGAGDCFLDPSFNISCITSSTSTDPPKAYITILDKEVIEISETYVRVKYPSFAATTCYDGLREYEKHDAPLNLSGTQYTLSSENWLTAIGCDDMVLGTEHPNGSLVGSSCASLCGERNHTGGLGYCPDNGFWSVLGNGCCRSPITGVEHWYENNSKAFSDEVMETTMAPVVRLDWRIGNKNCTAFKDTRAMPTSPEDAMSRSLIIDLSATQFALSTQNVLTALGCDDMAVAYGKSKNTSFVGCSCAALCTRSNGLGDYGSCAEFFTLSSGFDWYMPGTGCCQTPISRGIAYLEANLTDLSGQWRRKLFPCSYAFVTEKTMYSASYPLEYLTNSTAPITDEHFILPVLVLDWRIGKESCNVAQTRGNAFGCKANTRCVDFDENDGGYLCHCLEGYQGNPYLGQGCQDIDECGDDTTNPCNSSSICINTPGSVTCVCPRGFYGDGRKDGPGCIQVTQSKSKTIILTGMGSALGQTINIELLTGQRVISMGKTVDDRSLATRFLTCMEEKRLDKILDPQVLEQGRMEEVLLVARLAQRCLNLKGKMRPTMKEVSTELESLRISHLSCSTLKEEFEDGRAFEVKPISLSVSDIEYSWTASYKSPSASSSDAHPINARNNLNFS
ncbi:hypothetical protein SASPL_103626 [Salvia splendens]|uniref:EGF-like domain-containing protein n=1 Tax=Salvia splendens TaxID=180675 RepID=A0A8X8YG42_SALSN|nr:hypothetical protein SASPL_103626 [Salvia splendens]